MTLNEIKQLIRFCKANSVEELSYGDLSFKLSPNAFQQPLKPTPKGSIANIPDSTMTALPEVPWAKFTDEQLAVWSSPSEPSNDDGVI